MWRLLRVIMLIIGVGSMVARLGHPAVAACSSSPTGDFPGWGSGVTLSSCNKTISSTTGIDWATLETSTANTAVLTLTNSSLTLNNGAVLAAGSVVMGSNSSIAIDTAAVTKGKFSKGTPLYVTDTDDDGWADTAINSATLYTATGSGKRRMAFMRGWTVDCGASNFSIANVCGPTDFGDGHDGNVTFTVNTNINVTNLITGRSCADGGDAVNYSVTALGTNTATLSTTPSAGCLAANDEVILINLQGTSSVTTNVGHYESFLISSISTNTITFTTNLTRYYGNGAADQTNIGTATTNQRVMLQRVPNYGNVTVNSGVGIFPTSWNGTKGGVFAFKANGTATITGGITAGTNTNGGAGYRGGTSTVINGGSNGGEAFCSASGGGTGGSAAAAGGSGSCGGGGGGGGSFPGPYAGGSGVGAGGAGGGAGGPYNADTAPNGGGGGYGSIGTGGTGHNSGVNGGSGTNGAGGAGGGVKSLYGAGGGGGGGTYGVANLADLYFGSGAGAGGGTCDAVGGAGGAGGGIVRISASTLTVNATTGTISSQGGNGAGAGCSVGGGGAGGSIRLYGGTVTLNTNRVVAQGGTGSASVGAGGSGRIAAGASGSISGTTTPTYTSISSP